MKTTQTHRLTNSDRRYLIDMLNTNMEQNMDEYTEEQFERIERVVQTLMTEQVRGQIRREAEN